MEAGQPPGRAAAGSETVEDCAAAGSPVDVRHLRLVLDTQVLLDLLVFGDPTTGHIWHSLARQAPMQLLGDAPCLDEWRHELTRPRRRRAQWERRRVELQQRLDRCGDTPSAFGCIATALQGTFEPGATQPRERPTLAAAWLTDPRPPAPLPPCRDPSDQKFLELAAKGRAHWLLSRDRALLEVGRIAHHGGHCRIALPEQAAGLAAATCRRASSDRRCGPST